ncbi:MAG TPA: helix-turn-helix transcriptional regulator [Limnobacter sp.]|nr:helix-turn-helix transcriptional regulator [Limnobacter sp.]
MSAQLKPLHAGHCVRELRQRHNLSQMDLALRVGVSQRHLSCIETGKASASREMLMALLDGLDAPLEERNAALEAGGYAPVYPHRPIHHHEMQLVNDVVDTMIRAHASTPAIVLDKTWNLLRFNAGFEALAQGLGYGIELFKPPANFLALMLAPGGLAEHLVNRQEVFAEVLRRASREAVHTPALQAVLAQFKMPKTLKPSQALAAPALVAHLQSPEGELKFVSTFTTFGTPMEITTASLKIEHMFPADDHTRAVMAVWMKRFARSRE